MPSPAPAERQLPSRLQALSFRLKTHLLQLRRGILELKHRPARHQRGQQLLDAPSAADVRAPIWTQVSAAEFPLTAGKIENLRLAALALNGIEVPANRTFSFWRQLGRTTHAKGFTTGRELREGCLVPNIGGGLCQISGLLYQAALKAQLEIVERHAHSRTIPGSSAEQDLDATVFWNYVDLRFRAPYRWRLEVSLDASHLSVRIRAAESASDALAEPIAIPASDAAARPAATGDCLTCGQIQCFRHPSATAAHAPALGHSSFLLDARWPEFDRWCGGHSRDGDRWLLPLDAKRWRKSNYAWSPPASAGVHYATTTTLLRSLKQRRIPSQGAARQKALLQADANLAKAYAKQLSPECRHLVVSQNLLPHLWRLGVLGGRTFDVLLERWPLAELQSRLDEAASSQPSSPTLADFRADPELVRDESEALAHAGRLITPHRALAAHFAHRAWLLEWAKPLVTDPVGKPDGEPLRLFLPCSPLGRKGIHELAQAIKGIDVELLILGAARENSHPDPLDGITWHPASPDDLSTAHALLLPAWIEHQPRLALRALAMGIPVIASQACGLPAQPLLMEIDKPDPKAIANALNSLRPGMVPA